MQDIKTFKRLLYDIYNILNKKQRLQMVGMFFVILVGSLLELLSVTAMLPFIQSILDPKELLQKSYIRFFCDLFRIKNPNTIILMVGVGIILIYILKNAYLSLSSYLQAAYSNRIHKDLAVLMLRSYMKQSYTFFVETNSGVLMRGVQADINGVYQVMLSGFKLLSELLVLTSVASYLIAQDLVLAVGTIIVGCLCMLVVVFSLKRKITKMSSLCRSAGARQNQWLVQILEGIKDIFVYRKQRYFLKSYEDAYEDTRRALTQYTFVSALPERIIEAFCVSGIIGMILLRLHMGVDAGTFVPKMGVFAIGAFRLLPSVSRSTGYINSFVYYREWVESAYDNICKTKSLRTEKTNEETEEVDASSLNTVEFRSSLKISSLKWKYPKANDYVLEDLSLSVHKGESIGLIGESGSGKSTLADILLRLYKPQSGEILMDGVNIESIPNNWAKIVGYVPQMVFLIDDTIRGNIVFWDESVEDEKVWNALHQASLDEYVKGLPDGLDTIVGERGVKFSGGQRQRIAIARALYAGPQILILDEATSALDNETEEAVMEAIDSLAGVMTLIIIAHRITTLKNCDRIFEIVDGRAIERKKEDIIDD